MTIFTIEIDDEPVASFSADDKEAAKAFVDDGTFRDDLLMFETEDGPIWNGADPLEIRIALPEEVDIYHELFVAAFAENSDHTSAWICFHAPVLDLPVDASDA